MKMIHVSRKFAEEYFETVADPSADLLVITDDARYDAERWLSPVPPTRGLVLAPVVSARRRSFWRRWCMEHHVPVHDVKLHGAFILPIHALAREP